MKKKEYPSVEEEEQILEHLKRTGRRIKKLPKRLVNQVIELDSFVEYRYTYEGPAAQRSFCRKIQGMNKEWTRQEINQMSFRGENKKFGHNRNNYSIWNYKGGKNCVHHWSEWAIMEDNQGRLYKVNNGPADGKAGQKAGPQNNYWTHPSNVK